MANYLTLATIQALAAEGDYGGSGFLQPSSAVIALSAATWLNDPSFWRGASYEITEDEWDEISALVAQLVNDLTETGDMYPIDKVSVTNSVSQSIDASTGTNVFFDTDIYDPEDMHDTVTNNNRIYVLKDGLYLVNASVEWSYRNVGYRSLDLHWVRLSVPQNITIAETKIQTVVGSTKVVNQLCIQLEAIEGDYFYLSVFQNSPLALNLTASPANPRLSVVRLSS